MAITKGSKHKFSKKRTDLSTPAIVEPKITISGGSWTGAADIDLYNAETMYFHLFGTVPSNVLLYVYAERMNQMFYTELGTHDHGPGNLTTGYRVSGTNLNHRHYNGLALGSHNHGTSQSSHRHSIKVGLDDGGRKIDVDGDQWNNGYRFTFPVHDTSTSIMGYSLISISVSSTNLGSKYWYSNYTDLNSHRHAVETGNTSYDGIVPDGSLVVRSSGTPKTYFDNMQIEVDGVDRTTILKSQAGITEFGDGTSGHLMVTSGIELDLSPYIIVPGQHKVKFSLLTGAPNGGKLRYVLYAF